jgi:hypothetical protein
MQVSLDVFNLLGERVATIASGMLSAGQHSVNFDAARFASGVYVYRLQSDASTLSKKFVLLK